MALSSEICLEILWDKLIEGVPKISDQTFTAHTTHGFKLDKKNMVVCAGDYKSVISWKQVIPKKYQEIHSIFPNFLLGSLSSLLVHMLRNVSFLSLNIFSRVATDNLFIFIAMRTNTAIVCYWYTKRLVI